MGRKVFLAVLGTGFYDKISYRFGDKMFALTRFIQDSTLQMHDVATWTESDAVIVAMTAKARSDNWRVEGNTRRKFEGAEVQEYVGLQQVIEAMHLSARVVDLPIPEGKDDAEMWQVFDLMYRSIEEGDELYVDLTHGFRYLPMLLLVLLDYARFLKHVSVRSVTYGNFEARVKVGDIDVAPIVDLMPLIDLQSWTYAASELVKDGNPRALKEMVGEKVNKKLRDSKDPVLRGLNEISKKLVDWVTEIRTCRGKTVMASANYRKFRELCAQVSSSSLPPLPPIIHHIAKTFDDNGFSTETSDTAKCANQYAAARWCAEMQMWQSAITFLQEAIVTRVCQCVGLNVENQDNRQFVSNLLSVVSEGKRMSQWDFKESRSEDIRHLLSVGWLSDESFCRTYGILKDLRNDFNHAGMRQNPQNGLAESVSENIAKVAFVFDEDPEMGDEYYERCLQRLQRCDPRCFINLSNHPSSGWSEEQLAAAARYGDVEDMTFPQVDPAMTKDEVEGLVAGIVKEIEQRTDKMNVTVHLMGEMTLTYRLVSKLKRMGVRCVASTTARVVSESADGTKTSQFRFVQFREY